MSDILCRWLNSELRLSKSVEPNTFAKDFSSGYLIGEVLHKYHLQDDFNIFIKSNTSKAKLNNFTRIEPTLNLLGIPFDLTTAQALMQEQHGAARHLLYQLYILLQKKETAGLPGTAMETTTACMHRKEKEMYSDCLHVVAKRDTELKLQKVTEHHEERARQWDDRSVMAQQQKQLQVQEERRVKDTEKLRAARLRHNEIMAPIQASVVPVPKPPPRRSLQKLEKRQQLLRKQQAQKVQAEIAEFERNRKKRVASVFGSISSSQSVPGDVPLASSSQGHKVPTQKVGEAEAALQFNSVYIQRIRQGLEEDTLARQESEKRRRTFLIEQLKAHEAWEDVLREEQLVQRLTRQTKLERQLAAQLMQMRMQKEVIRQNRLVRERQYQERRERDFQEALEREAALAQQAKLDHAEEIRKERELYNKMAAERAQNRYRKHFEICRAVVDQIVDLATKAGEYRLLTGNLIPGKLMREWKELLFSGVPLYEPEDTEDQQQDPIELERLEILNNQDYDEYTNMVGEWAWPEDAVEPKAPPTNNWLLGHVVQRLRNIVYPPALGTPPPSSFPHHTLKACILGKFFSGKTTCLVRIAQVHGIRVLSADTLIREALAAYQTGEEDPGSSEEAPGKATEQQEETQDKSSSSLDSGQDNQEESKKKQLSVRAQLGAAAEKVLRKGKAIPDELLVDIMMEAIRQVPVQSGWILDGFPVDINQARLLDKALGGSADLGDGATDSKKRNQRTNLAVGPNAPKEPPPPAPVLDLALLLDIPDVCVLNRAARQTWAEKGKEEPVVLPSSPQAKAAPPAVEKSPPDSTQDPDTNSAGIGVGSAAATALPPRDKSLEKRQIQHRLIAFQDTWPKLEKWFGGKQGILVRVDADVEEEELFRRVESALKQAMIRAQKADVLESGKTPQPVSPAPGLSESSPSLTQDPVATVHSPRGSHNNLDAPASRKLSKSGSHSGRSKRLSICSSSNENSQCGPNSPFEPTPRRPGSANVIYVDEPLPQEVPGYLCSYWETVCESYVSNVKANMQNLRSERTLIIHDLFNMRQEFKHYLCRPDLKQEFVTQWQQDYNSVPDDMRDDKDTKAELHHRLDDMRERLWDICDKRREDAGKEREAFVGDGWLEDHRAVLINQYSSLMQAEVDRFQGALCVLRDYYSGMYRPVLPELPSDFTCIPLLDITETEDTLQGESTERETKSDCGKQDEREDIMKMKEVPLIPRRPPSTKAVSKQKGPQQAEDDMSPDDKLVSDIYQMALTAINNLVSAEAQQREVEVNEESQRERERMEKASQASAAAASAKDKNKKSGGKKKTAPSTPLEPSPPTVIEESAEEIHKREVRTKIREEYAAALEHEERAALVRIEMVRGCALAAIHSLRQRAEEGFSSMEEWLGAHYVSEMNSIEQLVGVVRHHIESCSKIQSELVLVCNDFYLNGDMRVVTSPPPPPRPAPREKPTHSALTVAQLESLYSKLHNMAPSGLVSAAEFSSVLWDMISLDMGSESLPEPWINITNKQLMEIVSLLTLDCELLDWHQFLLSAALPWPLPSLTQLLAVLQRFKTADTNNMGYINQGQYLQVELWFPSERPSIPEDPSEPLPYDRLDNLRRFFFQLFADHSSSPPRLDYLSMLQHLAAHTDPAQGFTRALSVVLGLHLKLPSTGMLVKSMPNIEDATDLGPSDLEGEGEGEEEEETPCGTGCVSGEEGVSIDALLTVVCHGDTKTGGHTPFHPGCRSHQELTEELEDVFRALGYGPEECVPFSILSQHRLVQDLMEGSAHCQLIDIDRVLQADKSIGETPQTHE